MIALKRIGLFFTFSLFLLMHLSSVHAEVTTQMYSNTLDKDIPDNSSTGATRSLVITDSNVPDAAIITEVTYGVIIDHTFPSDLFVTLTSPAGTTLTLWNNEGGGDDGDDDDDPERDEDIALGRITTSFNGESIKGGGWVFKAVDSVAYDTGSFDQIALKFKYEEPTVSSVTPLTGIVDQAQNYTVNGAYLPSTLAFTIAGADGCGQVSYNSTQVVFRCIPRTAGSKQYIVKDRSGGTALKYGTVVVSSAPSVIEAGYPKAEPDTADIGEPVVFTLQTTIDVGQVNIDMGGGNGFEPMYHGLDEKTWRLTRYEGFVTSGIKPVAFNVYDTNNNLLESASLNVTVSENIFNPPYTRGNPSVQGIPAPHGVVTLNGNLYREFIDMTAPNRGLDFIFSRSFNSIDKRIPGWRFNYTQKIKGTENGVIIEMADGSEQRHYRAADNLWYAHDRVFDILLQRTDGSFDLYTKSDVRYHFDSLANQGKLRTVSDRNGNSFTLYYDSNGYVDYIRDNQSRTYNFIVDIEGHLLKVTDFTGRYIEYTWSNDTLIRFRDVRGFTTQYEYDMFGNLTKIIDPRLNNVRYEYADGQAVAFTDEFGNTTDFTYASYQGTPATAVYFSEAVGNDLYELYWFDEFGRLIERIDAMGHKSSFSYKSPTDDKTNAEAGLVVESKTPRGDIERYAANYAYSNDGRGNKENITLPVDAQNNEQVQLEWQATIRPSNENLTNQNLITKLTPAGISSKYEYSYNLTGQVTRIKDPLGRIVNMTYNNYGQLTQKTDAKQNSSTYSYDSNGFLRQATDPYGNTITYTRDALGRPTAIQDKRGNITRYTYDASGNVLRSIDPLGGVTEYIYDGNGNLTRRNDPRNNATTNTYDAANRQLTSSVTVGGTSYTTQYSYDALGRVTSVTNRNNRIRFSKYDAAGNLLEETDSLNNTVTYTYDANDNIATMTDEEGKTITYTYDRLDRVIAVEDDQQLTRKTLYNEQGLVKSREDERGNITRYAYDTAGQLRLVKDPNDVVTEITYDANGNRETVKEPEGHITTYGYDKLNRLVTMTDHAGRTWQYVYDANGNRIDEIKPDGAHTTREYDGNNRVTKMREYGDNGSLLRTLSYTYDANDNITSKSNGSSTLHYTYDELNRIKTATDHFGKTIQYAYDGVGNLIALTYPGSKTVQYSYDTADRLRTVTDWLNNSTNYTRNKRGQITQAVLGNGVRSNRNYDPSGRLVSLNDVTSTGDIIASFQMALDQGGNIVHSTADQPLQPVLPTSSVMSYDSTNRLVQSTQASFTHDPNGRLIEQHKGGDSIEYIFNHQDLITSIKENGNTTAQYSYDVNNNRVRRVINGTETRYVVDANARLSQVLAETNSTGTVQRYYVYGEGLISQIDTSSNAVLYYHYDPTGNTVALTDAGQQVTDAYAYTPYGVASTQGSTVNPFLYSGKYGVQDDGNGLNYMRARYYKPEVKRFLSLDALWGEVESPQSLNRYAYAQGNPKMYTDPSGYGIDTYKIYKYVNSKTNDSMKKLGEVLANLKDDYTDGDQSDAETIKYIKKFLNDADNHIATAFADAAKARTKTGRGQDLNLRNAEHYLLSCYTVAENFYTSYLDEMAGKLGLDIKNQDGQLLDWAVSYLVVIIYTSGKVFAYPMIVDKTSQPSTGEIKWGIKGVRQCGEGAVNGYYYGSIY